MRADETPENLDLQLELVRLTQTTSASEQVTRVKHIFELVKTKPDPANIDSILPLLNHSNDAVVYWGAMTIGLYGGSAKAALPRLEKIASENRGYGSKTSQSGAATAIKRIKAALEK